MFHRLTLIILLTCATAASATVLYRDDFSDGDYTTADSTDGLTWTVVRGTADASANSLKLTDNGLAVTDQVLSGDSVTVAFKATSSWSRELSFVFYYRDTQNYYYCGLSSRNKGVYRVMDGDTTRLYSDNGSLIRIPHASGASARFKFFMVNTGSTIEIIIDRYGNGADYDAAVTDDDPAAVALFTSGSIGAELNGPFDDFVVSTGLVREAYDGVTYYVDAAAGDDTRTKAEAQSSATPWKTVQAGADSAVCKDTVVVAAGTYAEAVTISHSGSVFDKLTLRGADAGDRPVLDGGDSLGTGISISSYRQHVVIENFEITGMTGSGIINGSGGLNNMVNNCHLHHNGGYGIKSDGADYLTVHGCLINDNANSGISFTKGRGFLAEECEITMNLGEAGIWAGGGSSSYFTVYDVTVRNCFIHHQPPVTYHADNFQLHQVQGILLENNVFIQEGQQNMWCQYTDDYEMRNNIFMGGPLGINSCMHNRLYHNVFYNSMLRYDQHQTNHPDHGDYYKPQSVDIQNNLILESSIAWTPDGLVDRFSVFDIDFNYFNIANDWSRTSWTFGGYLLSVQNGRAVTEQVITEPSAKMSYRASLTWSADGRFIIMYKDTLNYYELAMAGNAGIYRVIDGVETKLHDAGDVKLPHASGAAGDFTVAVTRTAGSVDLAVTRIMDGDTGTVSLTDDDAAAAAAFAGGYRVGFSCRSKFNGRFDELSIAADGRTLYDGFNDNDMTTAEGDTGLTWTVIDDTVTVVATGGRGIGIGEHSRLDAVRDSLSGIITALPDTAFETYDFRPPAGSWLINRAARIAGIGTDKDGNPRIMGGVPDIGPYEYYTTAIDDRPADASDAPPRVIRFNNPARALVTMTVAAGIRTVRVTDATGRQLATLPVVDGRAVLKPAAYGITTGLLLLTDGNGAFLGRLVLTR